MEPDHDDLWPYSREDLPKSVLFIDIHGWSRFTEDHPTRHLYERGSDQHTWNRRSPLPARIASFHDVITERTEWLWRRGDHIDCLKFSDCAFLSFADPLVAITVATLLMRDFIEASLPVRMGLAEGTFYCFAYAMNGNGVSTQMTASFGGTGVVRAHQAEQHGGKGLRIFVGGSLSRLHSESLALGGHQLLNLISLRRPSQYAVAEVDYLLSEWSLPSDRGEAFERALFASVHKLCPATAPQRIKNHYFETLSAMNRMRRSRGKRAIRMRSATSTHSSASSTE